MLQVQSTDRDELQNLVSQKEAQIRQLRDEIQVLKAHQNALAPVSRLPVEVLARTFFSFIQAAWEVDQDLTHSKKQHYRPPVVEVTHVCRQWRSIALSYPRLWTRITSASFSSRWVEEQLERSQDAALYVQIPQEERTLAIAKRVFQVIMHLQRFWSLCISAQSGLNSISVLVPNLFLISGAGATQLRHVTLNDCAAPWTSNIFSGLTSLKLAPGTNRQTESMGTLAEFLDAMERMPALAELTLAWIFLNLQEMDGVSKSRVVKMPKLEKVALQMTIKEGISILQHISIPISARINVQAMAIRSGRQWFDDEEIQSSLLPTLGSCIEKAFLSNPLANYAPGSPTSLDTGLGYPNQTSPGNPRPIKSLCFSITDDESPTNKAAIEGWFENINFWQVNEDGSTQPEEHGSTSVPVADLAVYLGVRRHDGIKSGILGHHFLRMIPSFSNIESIAMEGNFLQETFKYIGELPSLEFIYLKDQAAVGFLRYVFEMTVSTGSSADDTTGVTMDDTSSSKNTDTEGRVVPHFPKLTGITLEGVNFGTSDNREPRCNTLIEFLQYRRDVLGPSIHRLSIYSCNNVSADDVEEIESIVHDVAWDHWD